MDSKRHITPEYSKLLHDQQERVKELGSINQTTRILKENRPVEETLRQIALLLPSAWQYSGYTTARITFMQQQYESVDFRETRWRMAQEFETIDGEKGLIEIFYTMEFREEYEGPFLKEERDLIINISSLIAGYLNSRKASDYIGVTGPTAGEEDDLVHVPSKKLLQRFLDMHNAERDVFHDLQLFKVKEILLLANLYDAYSIEGEGRFADHILGEYHHLSLTSIPRITGVSGEEEAFDRLRTRHYDMIIIMIGVDRESPMELCRKIRDKYPYIPTFLLLNNPADMEYIERQKESGIPFDNYFVWTGDSKVFFAMVSLLEDRVNVENDTRKGLTGVILLVEDSADYYSSYLPMLYSLVMDQTRSLIEDVSADELYKVFKLRTRPKILLAPDWESAMNIFTRYRNNLLCVISDIRFPRNGVMDDKAGFELIRYIKEELPNLPAVLQSSDPENVRYAFTLKSNFINKNSPGLLEDLKSFINHYLGFGHFVYRDNQGRQIAVAKTMKEFESFLETVPEDSLAYHAHRNHFSLWLMARGEVKIAKLIYPMKVSDFGSLREMREFLIGIIRKRRQEMNKGRVISFEAAAMIDETNVISLSTGSLGGKGRGLAFINSLIYSFGLGKLIPGINIRTPITAIARTDEFDLFMERNHLWNFVKGEKDFLAVQRTFLAGSLSYTLEKKLRAILGHFTRPLAVRSSSLFEDSMSQPFSGIFGTYLLPNNNPDPDIRLRQLSDAIKLVYASIYSEEARAYFDAVRYKLEVERMAVVIQEVVGNQYEDVFYPHISGSAQSFNFYPIAHMKPGDGLAVAAVGLGQYVMDGELSYRFSPVYPSLEIISQKDLYKNSQVWFYAVDLGKQDLNLLEGEKAGLRRLEISSAERHGTIGHSASVLNPDNDMITPGLDSSGPRVINFADILKYDYIPLASTLRTVLDVVSEACGTPVEIEFAVDLNKDGSGNASFYLLQLKPLLGTGAGYNIAADSIDENKVVLLTRQSMGNGMISDITDIIYIEPERFDNKKTVQMAGEIAVLNDMMVREDRKYVLIGPGRWGSRDRFLGIPVVWAQISNAGVIVELSLPDFHTDASLGSHFFHNVISMNVGYFSLHHESDGNIIDWNRLRSQEVIWKGEFFSHVRFREPLLIRMDGKKGMAVISVNQ